MVGCSEWVYFLAVAGGDLGRFYPILFRAGRMAQNNQNENRTWQQLDAHLQFMNWLSTKKPSKNALKQYNRLNPS
ncbi:hypothetical protein GCM10027347_51470 [Larkinella harenae]